ncbi:MAG: DegT/DnrJ/EryC1/StrS family aminotransferase [Waltera sp.]
MAKYLQVKYCSAVNSGSSARSVGVYDADIAIAGGARDFTRGRSDHSGCRISTTVTPMLQYGAVPVFVDVTIPQYNIDTDRLEEAFSPKTKAVMIAHTLGNPFDLKKVKDFCDRHDLWLVEDNCDALGSRYCMNE